MVTNANRDKPNQIVDTYVSLLVDSGIREATIGAVARKSGLSKAGLLHHFPSRAALDAGLLVRLRELVDQDLGRMRRAEKGPAHYYLRSSFEAESALERTVVAATRLSQTGNAEAGAALRWARDRWYGLLVDELGDPLVARFVLLAGDGVSYHTDISTTADGRGDELISPADIDSFVGVLREMRMSPGS